MTPVYQTNHRARIIKSQRRSIPIYGESDTDDNPEQIQADVRDKPSKMLTKSVKLLLNQANL